MANYKNTVFNDLPTSFWTFDYDTTANALENNVLLDEISDNNMIIFGPNYSLEHRSLNDVEVNDQWSMRVAENQKWMGDWSPTYFSVADSPDYIGLSSFSFEFFFQKSPAGIIRNSGEPGQYQDIYSPLINKGTLYEIRTVDKYSGTDYIEFKMFNGARSIKAYENSLTPLWNNINHCVVTYNVELVDIQEYQATMTMYINGRWVAGATQTYYDSVPSLNDINPITFAGTGNPVDAPLTSYQTELLKLDQISFYDYALTSEQVSYHYKKTQRYNELILADVPTYYWRMNELSSLSNNYMYASAGDITGRYYDGYLNDQDGPDQLKDSRSTAFLNGGSASATYYSSGLYPRKLINIGENYTVEFWFKVAITNTRGALFSCYEEIPDWKGLNIYINSQDGVLSSGTIEVSESKDRSIHASGSWSDDEWHHLAVVRSGNNLKIRIDGNNITSEELPAFSANGVPSQIHLMGAGPDNLYVTGQMCEVAMYTHALQDLQLNSRYHFATRHKIFGYTLLEGNPVSAKVRFYDTITGEKVSELTSNYADGSYTYYPFSDRNIDIVALLPENDTTRYRVHGPIRPADYSDPHDTI